MTTTTGQTPIKRTDLQDIVPIKTLLPWKVTDISVRPFPGMWSFNPSVHFDGELWRCAIRCADYAMPKGVAVRGDRAHRAYVQSNNAMLILDPDDWRVAKVKRIREADDYPRVESCPNVGYEDMRLFRTDTGGLQAIAASLHLDRRGGMPASTLKSGLVASPSRRFKRNVPMGRGKVADGAQPAPRQGVVAQTPQHQHQHQQGAAESHPPEQVILSFDQDYAIIKAHPIRGSWSGMPQKNWSPFDACEQPRFLYSIDRGILFDDQGPLMPMSGRDVPLEAVPTPAGRSQGGPEVRMTRRATVIQAGRVAAPSYDGIRGGTQLIHIADLFDDVVGPTEGGAWLGCGHEMRFVSQRKFYFHYFYVVDSSGRMLVKSPPIKLAPDGIEFAAGMAIDGSRVVISFGIDDMHCKIGETDLDALLDLLADPPDAKSPA